MADAIPGDSTVTQVTDEYTDENGNTVVVGYPSNVTTPWEGEPDTDPNGPGLGLFLGDGSNEGV